MSTPGRSPMGEAVVAMLWDADGVLQHLTRGLPGWTELLDGLGGPGFAEAVFAAEVPAMTGAETMRDCLARVLRDFPSADASVEDLLGVWESFEVDEEAVALVEQTRALGVRCYLATNQQDHRAEYMRRVHGYDAWFDGVFYSSEVGAAKPAPLFFERALAGVAAHLGVGSIAPRTVGFVDDNAENVAAAAAALGIRAVRHVPASGVDGLRDDLASIGVVLGPA
ncbi:HAD family hydrolase [Nostocoides japonicum]|nr:HAD family hydrolase [Tetrasphaera japonica]